MKIGDYIFILPSEELAEMQLMPIAFRHGRIVEIRSNTSGVYGAWVELVGEPYYNEQEWFIPIESMKYEGI